MLSSARLVRVFRGACVVLAASCAVGERQVPSTGVPVDASAEDAVGSISGEANASKDDAATKPDAGAKSDAASAVDAAKSDGASDAGAGKDASSSGLDPDVVLPDPNADPCSPPGSSVACGGVRACRMASPSGGRCDDCNPQGTCSGLVTTACTQSLDCDINLQCFRGKCTLFCTLPQGPECGNPNICVDVGHPTIGLCDPWQLF